ncbi:MAG TPA: molybdenum cofactor guanylyltransferase [Desulfocapsa sulfexigens]|nr:molybdenum cofactor guanylyltransferase [Desulfocapsa sulfexigens]
MNKQFIQQQEIPLRACLLIGGRSSRMGRPKHLIKGSNGLTWIENSVCLLKPFTQDIVLSGAGDVPDVLSSLTRIPDVPDVQGPLTGILAAMRWNPDSCWLLLACDMPNISPEALKWLLSKRTPDSWGTVPRLKEDGFVEPLLAVYEPQAKEYLEELRSSGCLRISMVARRSKIATPVVPKELCRAWSNINTPDELSLSLAPAAS